MAYLNYELYDIIIFTKLENYNVMLKLNLNINVDNKSY
jgi:hypothetical protein